MFSSVLSMPKAKYTTELHFSQKGKKLNALTTTRNAAAGALDANGPGFSWSSATNKDVTG